MKKNLTIRTEEMNLAKWRFCAQLERLTLNAWVCHTLNMEAEIMEESLILKHQRTIMFSSHWDLMNTNGTTFGSVVVEVKTTMGSENAIVCFYDKENNEINKLPIPFGSFTKKEISRTIKGLLEKLFPGVRILVDLEGNLLET